MQGEILFDIEEIASDAFFDDIELDCAEDICLDSLEAEAGRLFSEIAPAGILDLSAGTDADLLLRETLLQASYNPGSLGYHRDFVEVGAGFTGHFDAGRFVPDCIECGAWQPYDGHCDCVNLGSFDDDFLGDRFDSLTLGNSVLVFGSTPASGGQLTPVFEDVVMQPPYDSERCWLLCFKEEVREAIQREIAVTPTMTLRQIIQLHRFYPYNEEKISLVASDRGSNVFHFLPDDGTRVAMPMVDWIVELYTPGGYMSRARTGVFGAAGSYTPWAPRGEAARLSRTAWISVDALREVVMSVFLDPFSKQASRTALLAQMQQCVVHGLCSSTRRFPADGAFVPLDSVIVGGSFRQAMSALEYKDGSKDDKAKSNVDESGDVRERGYGDSLATFANAFASVLSGIYNSSEVLDRGAFERVCRLTWSGADDSLPVVWRQFNAAGRALSQLPWLFSGEVDDMLQSLELLNPALNEHLPRILASVRKALSIEPPYTPYRTFDTRGKGECVSVCMGDWPQKLARLVMVAGYLDGTKDEKFKRDQRIPETKSQDRNDMQQQFRRAKDDIRAQYVSLAYFIVDDFDLRRYLGIVPAADTGDDGGDGHGDDEGFSAHVVVEL